jgi:hypothetical protein
MGTVTHSGWNWLQRPYRVLKDKNLHAVKFGCEARATHNRLGSERVKGGKPGATHNQTRGDRVKAAQSRWSERLPDLHRQKT